MQAEFFVKFGIRAVNKTKDVKEGIIKINSNGVNGLNRIEGICLSFEFNGKAVLQRDNIQFYGIKEELQRNYLYNIPFLNLETYNVRNFYSRSEGEIRSNSSGNGYYLIPLNAMKLSKVRNMLIDQTVNYLELHLNELLLRLKPKPIKELNKKLIFMIGNPLERKVIVNY